MKQFSKIKNLADKAFIRPDRTEVLSEDLIAAEKRIELIKKICDNTAKKVAGGLQGKDGQQGRDIEKRIRKTPQYALGHDMNEHGDEMSEITDFNSVLGAVLKGAGEIEMKVATDLVTHEVQVENEILSKLQTLIETDLHNISKTKKTLNKLASDMDTAKAKLAQTHRHSMSAGASGKVDTFKDDFEDTQQKVEQCRDNLSAEMYQLISRESEISQYILNYLQLQRDYHRTAHKVFDDLLPNVESILATSFNKPVYGTDLEEHLQGINRPIAYPIELCVCGLYLNGMEEEGLFRIAGSASKVKKLKAAFDARLLDLDSLRQKFSDPHVIANALKCYLRELSTPLLTYELYAEWMDAIQIQNSNTRLQTLWTIVKKLPKANFDNLRYLIKFLSELSKHQNVNKMSPANIAIVIGPNLLWTPNSDDPSADGPMGMNMTMTHLYTSLVDQLITYADYFFKEEIEFFQTYPRPVDEHPGGVSNGTDEGGFNQQNENEGLLSAKRSQSSSSLEDHISPPPGSPKPVMPRKNKPAPVPPALVKANSGGNQNKPESLSPKQSFSSDSSSTSETTPKRIPGTKRDGGHWVPPSPSQTRTQKSTGSSASTTGAVTTSADSPTTVVMKVTPPKPPQPQFYQPKDSENKTSFADGSSKQNYSSTLRHKSSFNSGSVSTDSATQGGGAGGVTSNKDSSMQYSNSLPRRFHTDNSYKNQRAPRPPSIFAAIPTVPSTHATGASDPPSQPATDPKEPIIKSQSQQPSVPLPHALSDGTTGAAGNVPIPESRSSNKKLNSSQPGKSIESNQQQGTAHVGSIGFEHLETEIKSAESSEKRNSFPKYEEITVVGLPSGQGESSKPVPAPRSSLLLQYKSSKEKESIPADKERPTLMAKPRDRAKKSQPVPTAINPDVIHANQGTGDANNSPPDATAPIHTHQNIGFRVSVETEDSGNTDDSHLRNAEGVKDKYVPPLSPKAPNRPPRPHPPPPPKLKLESTDL